MTLKKETLQELKVRILSDGILSREEHEELISRLHLDGEIDEEESELLAELFDLISAGKIQVEKN